MHFLFSIITFQQGPNGFYEPNEGRLKERFIDCRDALCESVHHHGYVQCQEHNNHCEYEITYADAMATKGVLINDIVYLGLTNKTVINTQFVFG